MTTARTNNKRKTVSFDPKLAQENIDPRPEQKSADASKTQQNSLKDIYKTLKREALSTIQAELKKAGFSDKKITRLVAEKWPEIRKQFKELVRETADEVIGADNNKQPAAPTRKRKGASSSDAGLFKPTPRCTDTNSASPLKKVRVKGLR